MRLPVGIDSWVIECCLEPPGVGDSVDWGLQFIERGRWPDCDPEQQVKMMANATPLPDWEGATLGTWPVRLDADGATLYWEAPHSVTAGPVTVSGHITIAQHGEAPEDLPSTTGAVHRVRLITTLYEQDPPGSQSWRPTRPADVTYRDVDRTPKWFPDELSDSSPGYLTNAALVDLQVSHGRTV